jgi:hypothetical protein
MELMVKIMLSIFTLFGVVIVLFGCSNFESSDRYELVASAQGYVYRLDKKTGDVSIIEEDTIRKVSEGQIRNLVVGSRFKTEDGNVIRYAGKGKFEPAKNDPLGIRPSPKF